MENLSNYQPLKLTEDIADFCIYYLLKNNILGYYSAPKSSWTNLKTEYNNRKFLRYVKRDEPRADIVIQMKDNPQENFLVCEGKENIRALVNSSYGGAVGELERAYKFFKDGVIKASYELKSHDGGWIDYNKKINVSNFDNIMDNTCFCFNFGSSSESSAKKDLKKLEDAVKDYPNKINNIVGISFFRDEKYHIGWELYIKNSTSKYWKNVFQNL